MVQYLSVVSHDGFLKSGPSGGFPIEFLEVLFKSWQTLTDAFEAFANLVEIAFMSGRKLMSI